MSGYRSVEALRIQRELWLLQQLVPDVGITNIAARFQWHGPLDLSAFLLANGDYVRRHPFLRTVLQHCPDEGLMQLEREFAPPAMTVHDLQHLQGVCQRQQLSQILDRVSREPIDESEFPWVRLVVVRLAAKRFEIGFVFSHLVCDGLSMGILCRELLEAYQSRIAGREPSWKQEIDPDVVPKVVELEQLAADSLARINQPRLPGTTESDSPLPYDRHPSESPRYRGDRLEFEFDHHQSDCINQISRQHGCSPFVTWLSLIQLLFYRCSGMERFESDVVTSGRSRDLRRLVGPFFETETVTLECQAGWRFEDLLLRNQALADELNAPPADRRISSSSDSRSSRSRLLLDYQASLRPVRLSDDIEVVPSELDNGAALAELCIGVRRLKQRYFGHIKYDVDLFDRETVASIPPRLQLLLNSIVADPEAELGRLAWLSDSEVGRIRAINDTELNFQPQLIDDSIQRQCDQTPGAIAIIDREESISYSQLQNRVDSIACRLQHTGIIRGDRVALAVSRGSDTVAAMVAVLKCGAAYVPIDQQSPEKRRQLILEAGDVRCVLVDQRSVGRNGDRLLEVNLSENESPIADHQRETLEIRDRLATDAAYVLFTSGSTGNPKGVEVTHANLANFFSGVDALAKRDEESSSTYASTRNTDKPGTWLAVTSSSFDISAFELLWPLTHGYSVVLAGGSDGKGSLTSEFAETVARCSVTHFQCTPALMQLLLTAQQNRDALSRLERIFVGGDVLPERLADQLAKINPGKVFNMYGPTETTIWSTAWKLKPGSAVRIGRPLANQQTWVLDGNRELCPPSVEGELHIGGAGVANGYLGDEQLTHSRFVEHPELGRLFATGDRVKLDDSDELEFVGRADYQVKLHGHRFELGEVESVLLTHPAVSQAVVILDQRTGATRLRAFVVTANSNPNLTPELRPFLAERLPGYMIPAEFVRLEKLPLGVAGKVDRVAIANAEVATFESLSGPKIRPDPNHDSWNQQFLNQMRSAICEELQIDSIPDDARWSDLAISSLEIVGLVARMERDHQLNLPVPEIFRNGFVDETILRACESASRIAVRPVEPAKMTEENLAGIEEGVI